VTATAAPALPDAPAAPLRAARRLVDLVRRRPELVTTLLCALVLAASIRGPDLPAQNYRVWLLRTHGLIIFDSHWYAGHTLPGYSLLFPPMAAVIGPRLLGALACIASTAAFTRLLRGRRDTGNDVAILWFAVITVVDLVVGRLPFALGVAFGVGALAAVRERRGWWAFMLAVLCSAASPLAGAFLLLAGAAWLPAVGWRRAGALAGAVLGIAAAAAFGEAGFFPFPVSELIWILGFCAISLVLAPRAAGIERRGLALYGLAAILLYVAPNPIGGNIIRLGAIFAGPLAAYVCMRYGMPLILLLVAGPLLAWQLWPVPDAVANGDAGGLSAHAGYYTGLAHYIESHPVPVGRVEVPLTRGRWETDYLAAKVPLARGWERQVDLAYNAVLYNPKLSASAYHNWLRSNGVRWVALPDVALDSSEAGEQALLTGPELSFLKPVWHNEHWQLWEVRDPAPLTRGPLTLLSLDVSKVNLQALGAGESTLLVRWTRFWKVVAGVACVESTPDGWTQVRTFAPGPVTISAQVGFGSLAGGGGGGNCSAGVPDGTRP
jgi:hypothetical protein